MVSEEELKMMRRSAKISPLPKGTILTISCDGKTIARRKGSQKIEK